MLSDQNQSRQNTYLHSKQQLHFCCYSSSLAADVNCNITVIKTQCKQVNLYLQKIPISTVRFLNTISIFSFNDSFQYLLIRLTTCMQTLHNYKYKFSNLMFNKSSCSISALFNKNQHLYLTHMQITKYRAQCASFKTQEQNGFMCVTFIKPSLCKPFIKCGKLPQSSFMNHLHIHSPVS